MGQYRPECIPDDWIWAEYWTRYFTDRQSRYSWAVRRRDGSVAGYLTGTPRASQADLYGLFLAPGIVAHTIAERLIRRPASRAAIRGMLRSLLRGEMEYPPGILKRYPATWHVNLLADARGRGLGGRLFDLFRDTLASEGVSGIHARPLSVNAPIQHFLRSRGFRQVDSRPLHAFDHVEGRLIELQTWILPL
jgi:GNAT superfamily N-acetyltransferase